MFYPEIPSRQTEPVRHRLPNSPIAAEQVDIVRFLTDPETFGGHAPAYFDTAVSHLFVCGSHLYVLRKPIDDDGFRCATVHDRWDWCETQCMRGVSGFGVVGARPFPIVRREGRMYLGGPGSIRDWVLRITCESVTVDKGFITLQHAA
ncbi:MAG: hypothetical protein V7675_11725 [Hyphomonas sp.]|uniref:hypothetical protein n=1 Tax=Hyphomonas sp. TaxID=87 RepID=UPI003001D98D